MYKDKNRNKMLTNVNLRQGPLLSLSSGRIPGNLAGLGGDQSSEPPGADHEHRMLRDQD